MPFLENRNDCSISACILYFSGSTVVNDSYLTILRKSEIQ